MSLRRYSEYKKSGADWLGSVPAQWNVVRLKSQVSVVTEKANQRTHPVALENIEEWSGKFISTEGEFEGDGVAFVAGDLLFGKLRPYLAKAYLASGPGEAVGDFHVLRSSRAMNPRFLQCQILNKPFIDVIDGSTFGAKMPRVSWESLGNMVVTLPSLDEQTAIAAFLDRETAKIDALIAEQEKLVALLAEKCQATISHAVTKGLGANTPMRNSGVAWLGNVPAHWQVTQLKRLCDRITDGAHISPETEGGIFYFVSTKDLDGESINFERCLLTSPSSFDYLQRTGCSPAAGDVLFSKDGTIGRTVVVREGPEFVVASSLIIITPSADILDSDFLNYLCKSSVVSGQVDGFVKGAGLPRLSIQNLLKVVGLFPPIEEQRAISAYLKVETQKFAVLSETAERAAVLLKERRSALIAAAVTGQIDVCSEVLQSEVQSPEAIAA